MRRASVAEKSDNVGCSHTIILPVAHECETWSLILTQEHRLRVFQNRVLRRIFGTERDEVTGGWRKVHNEEFHNLYLLTV